MVSQPHVDLPRIVLQYMAESDNPNMRDGTDQDSAGGDGNDPTEEASPKSPGSVLLKHGRKLQNQPGGITSPMISTRRGDGSAAVRSKLETS